MMVFHRLPDNECNPFAVSLPDTLGGFEADEPSVGNESCASGLDGGRIATEYQSNPASSAAAFVVAVTLCQHGANEQGEHDAGVYRPGAPGSHEENEHAAWDSQSPVCVGVADIGQHLGSELVQFRVVKVIDAGRDPNGCG